MRTEVHNLLIEIVILVSGILFIYKAIWSNKFGSIREIGATLRPYHFPRPDSQNPTVNLMIFKHPSSILGRHVTL
jgi:hypothetical protein